MPFVDRVAELATLEDWASRRQTGLGMVWGRRRVGKTALLQRFAEDRRTVFHTASGRPEDAELAALTRAAGATIGGLRDLAVRPFRDWTDAIESLAAAAAQEPILLVLDEFSDLVTVNPGLPAILRATWDRIGVQTRLSILLCGSAVRTMEAIAEERAPLYGRLDLRLAVHAFRPHEAALMLPALRPTDRAVVYGLVGGVPLYLTWWDQRRSIRDNVMRLACTPGGLLLTEGELALATEADGGELGRRTLYAIAAGRTKHNEIADSIRADPSRTLERLVQLRLVERVVPVTEDPRRTRRRTYRIADNFLAFWLGLLDRFRPEIERGLGPSIEPILLQSLDDCLRPRWEEVFRDHLRLLAARGELGTGIVAIGSYWTVADQPVEIDAVALAGRECRAVLVGEAKWARRVDGARLRRDLEAKAAFLPVARSPLVYAIAARERVEGEGVLSVTARDIFGLESDPEEWPG